MRRRVDDHLGALTPELLVPDAHARELSRGSGSAAARWRARRRRRRSVWPWRRTSRRPAPAIGWKDTVNPSDSVNARSGAIRCAWESPVSGWLGGCERGLLDAVDRRDLLAVEHEHGLEQHTRLAGLLAADAVALLDGQWGDDRDRRFAFLDGEPEPQPGLEPGDERGVRAARARPAAGWTATAARGRLRAHADPALPALGGQQLLCGALQPLAVLPATLVTLGFGQPARWTWP